MLDILLRTFFKLSYFVKSILNKIHRTRCHALTIYDLHYYQVIKIKSKIEYSFLFNKFSTYRPPDQGEISNFVKERKIAQIPNSVKQVFLLIQGSNENKWQKGLKSLHDAGYEVRPRSDQKV